MKLVRNLGAALTNSTWNALISLAVVPLYLHYLGVEAYGLIGVFATIQALLQVLDLGLSPTISREASRLAALDQLADTRALLHTLALVFAAMSALIVVTGFLLAPVIATRWLHSDQSGTIDTARAISLMALVLAARWPVSLYTGALVGMQQLVTSSKISIAMVGLGSLGAVAVLAFASPTIEAFFLWQLGVALLHVLLIRRAAWLALGPAPARPRASLASLRRVWSFSASMSGVALSALVLSQLDKVLLSRYLPLSDFGVYVLASTVVGCVYLIVSPVFNIIYPVFSSLVATGEEEKLKAVYRHGTRALATVLFPLALFLALVPRSLIQLWTGDASVAARAAPLITIMAAGSALHGIMFFPYSLQLAHGQPRLALLTNVLLLALVAPMTYYLTTRFGVVGGAFAWLNFHVAYFLLGTWLTARGLLPDITTKWVFLDVLAPFCVCALVGALGLAGAEAWLPPGSDLARVLFGLLVAAAALVATAFLVPVSRQWVLLSLRGPGESAA